MKNNRREFIRKGSALAALSVIGTGHVKSGLLDLKKHETGPKGSEHGGLPEEHAMEIALQAPAEPTDNDISFIRQMGINQVVLWTDASKSGYEYYASRRSIYESAGIKIFGFGNYDVHNQDKIVLNLPGRDEKIEEYKNHIRNLGKAGIHYTTYAHMGNGIWSTERETTRGGASARAFNLETAKAGVWNKVTYEAPLTHGRKYSEDEIWSNYEYFIKQVAPVAESENVRIGIHPDDPPVPELGGIPRCIFSSFDGYKRALEIAGSPNVGICLCVGCWLEGGQQMGKDVFETINYFGKQKKIFKVHLRNVNRQLPHFTETFLDDGYENMYRVIKALKEVDFDGVLIADHIPSMVYGPYTGTAFSVGYMKALVERVIAEG
ncbi:MAG: mannonate dehydratase [Bacteroidales bacterium]|jgi:mannonate dehydratase|nr:mannonate dehydratase [Bacteroidales bacterium]